MEIGGLQIQKKNHLVKNVFDLKSNKVSSVNFKLQKKIKTFLINNSHTDIKQYICLFHPHTSDIQYGNNYT